MSLARTLGTAKPLQVCEFMSKSVTSRGGESQLAGTEVIGLCSKKYLGLLSFLGFFEDGFYGVYGCHGVFSVVVCTDFG